jgi:hypothetical protein
MKYKLFLETESLISFSIFPHNREGLEKALDKVDAERKKSGFRSAKIVSNRDGEVFALDMSLALA